MNSINIRQRHSMQNPIEFCIGNGRRLRFASKRESAAFVAETNRYLTKCLVILNKTYVEVFTEYRNFWMIACNCKAGTKTNYLELSQKIKSNLQAADQMLDKFSATWFRSNDPFFAFIDLKKVALFTSEAADMLCQHHKKRNNTTAYYNCLVLEERCKLIIGRLSDYDYVK